MQEKFEKYADLLLKVCINLQKDESLLIEAPVECFDFIRILNEKALKLGNGDVHIEWVDEKIKHDTLEKIDIDEIKNHPYWNKKIYDEYAKKNSAFLFLNSPVIGLMDDIDPKKTNMASYIYRTSRPVYNSKQLIYEVAWCIAAVPNYSWAKLLFKDSQNPLEDAWNLIFKICHVDDDPVKFWEEQSIRSDRRSDILNKYKFKTLHYTNSLGTNLYIGLNEDAIWCGARTKHATGKPIIVNMPTFENFTSPNREKTEGIVYSSKPLIYGGVTIENFALTFKNGKVVDVKAEKGLDALKKIISTDENSSMLGECALVDYNSPISLTNKIFYTTLYDENASCHIALGEGFNECIMGGNDMDKAELNKHGINTSKVHVDFMIGTKDLHITGIDKDGNEVPVFDNGNFVLK